MAGEILVSGSSIRVTCDGQLIVCDPESPTRLCCFECEGASFEVIVPCGPLLATISGIDETGGFSDCVDCSGANGPFELGANGCTEYPSPMWGEQFDFSDGVACFLIQQDMYVYFLACCEGEEIVLYVIFSMDFGFVNAVTLVKELDRQPIVEGACYTYDWSDPNETLTCATNVGTICTIVAQCFPNETVDCDVSNVTVVLTPA